MMITTKAPREYISGIDILGKVGERLSAIAHRAMIIGGKTALARVGEELLSGLDRQKIRHTTAVLTGYPTLEAGEIFSEKAKESGSDAIIGIGGGRAMDAAKAAGFFSGIPVVTVPTIAATCAAYAGCSILYDDQGVFLETLNLERSPDLIFADYAVLAKAPVRYLRAGIADTLAKWYEFEPTLRRHADLYLRLRVKDAELAREILWEKAGPAVDAAIRHEPSREFSDVADAVLFLAGVAGSVKGDLFYGGFAHPFYNCLSRIPETRGGLHGEKVSFGLVVEAVLEGRTDAEKKGLVRLLAALKQPLTLEALGIRTDVPGAVALVAEKLAGSLRDYPMPARPLSPEEIAKAIFEADRIGRSAVDAIAP